MKDSNITNHTKRVAILFSGGRDSSLTACLFALQGFKVHLISFISGLGVKGDLADYRFEELKSRFPYNIVERVTLPTFGLVRKIAIVNIEKDFAKHKVNLILVGEKLAMHTAATAYCIQQDIKIIADGTSGYQQDFAEQMPEALSLFRKFHLKWKIKYQTPILAFESEDSVKYTLMELGISPKSLEGTSMFAESFSKPTPDVLTDYIKSKLPICNECVSFLLKGNPQEIK